MNSGIDPDSALELKFIFHNVLSSAYSCGTLPENRLPNNVKILKDLKPDNAGDKVPDRLVFHKTILSTNPSELQNTPLYSQGLPLGTQVAKLLYGSMVMFALNCSKISRSEAGETVQMNPRKQEIESKRA